MLQPFQSLFSLRWTNEPYLAPLPEGIERTYIPASKDGTDKSKKLELLVCQPESHSQPSLKRKTKSPPILFLHGGFGSAAMYTDFMTYLSTRYVAPTYALSLRGHGASYSLSYFRMVYLTGLHELATDLATAVEHIVSITDDDDDNGKPKTNSLIILGHSSGGGLLQDSLAKRYLPSGPVSGIVLLDAIPNFGNISVYSNWARHDPWFSLRMSLVHFNHVASPLSSDSLVLGAFFGSMFRKMYDGEKVKSFRRLMTPYESLMWPLGMMKGWWDWICGRGGKWLDVSDILGWMRRYDDVHDDGDDDSNSLFLSSREKVCVIIGSEDVLMDIPNQHRMVEQYREGIRTLIQTKRVDWNVGSLSSNNNSNKNEDQREVEKGVEVTVENGVRFAIVEGAGHHAQNDVMWEKAAEQVRLFALRV